MRQIQIFKIALGVLLASLLAACGGGGGGAGTTATSGVQISGTAAAGAPVIGYVSVSDSSSNPQPVRSNIPIEANGHYTVDVTGLTPPFAFAADGTVGGKRVILYSAATADDAGKTINITPFTDLIIRNIAATAVDTYLSNPANMANLTTAQLDAQRIALTNALAPALAAMGVDSSIDLLRATFNADSTGLDRFMDVVKVDTTNPSAVTITNILDAANQLVIDTTASQTSLTASGTLPITGMDPTLTPVDSMLATGKAFASFFATGLPNPADPNLTALFSSTFMQDGMSSSAWLTGITTDTVFIGIKFANLVVDSFDATGTVAQVSFSPIAADGRNLAAAQGGTLHWQMKLDATTKIWQMDGNQRIAYVMVQPYAQKGMCNPASASCSTNAPTLASTPDYQSGLWFDISNQALQPIGTIVVTGPGLPAPGGVTLTAQSGGSWFSITTTNPNPCNYQLNCNQNYWMMSDAEIAQVTPNSVYTVKLYDTSANLMATYSNSVQAAPVANGSLAALSYPSLTGMIDLTGMGATTLTPSWNIPVGLDPSMLWIYAWQQSTGAGLSIGKDLNSATGTATFAITAPPSGGLWDGDTYSNYTIWATDQYGRSVITKYRD